MRYLNEKKPLSLCRAVNRVRAKGELTVKIFDGNYNLIASGEHYDYKIWEHNNDTGIAIWDEDEDILAFRLV